METLEAIASRRSIRKFKSDPIPDEALRQILTAGIQAPSGKNRQPWRFVVVHEDKRAEMVRILREGVAKHEARGESAGSAKWTANVMEQAPITVFIFNPEGMHPWLTRSIDQAFDDLVNIQSVGAAIENMLLAAQAQGIGSLWICDILYAYDEFCAWLGHDMQMVAAVSFGYPDESPSPRPRKPLEEVTVWL